MRRPFPRPLLTLVALFASLSLIAGAAAATVLRNVQANSPQVAGDRTSNTSAVFPTNKQNEPSIAVNPVSSRFLIAGSNDEQRQPPCGPGPVRGAVPASDCSFFRNVGTSGVYTSSDGGRTWTNRGLLDDQASWRSLPVGQRLVSDGDPVIVFGPRPDGRGGFSYSQGARAYYATLASYFDNAGPYPPNKAPEVLAVAYSDDNGLTWSAPALATIKENPNDFNDKEWIGVDDTPGSPYFGRVYLSWTEFRSAGGAPDPIMVAISTDGGVSFSPPDQLTPAFNNSGIGGRQGSMVVTGPDGSVYVAYEESAAQLLVISRDGGASWSRPITIGPVSDIADPIPGANFRTNSFPSIAADPRAGSTTLYVAWVTATPQGGRVVVATSSDRGQTWGAPVTVSTAAEGYAFFQGLDVAPNGRVDVGYQAQIAVDPATFGTGNARIDSYYVAKAPGSASWSGPLKISTASTDPAVSAQNNLQRQFMGDYNVMVSTNDRAWFIVTDTRRGAGCADVDAYQRFLRDNGLATRGDMVDRRATRIGENPYADDPSVKPAPPLVCPANFGDSDAYVSVITP